jgi:ERCC4-type nuclease
MDQQYLDQRQAEMVLTAIDPRQMAFNWRSLVAAARLIESLLPEANTPMRSRVPATSVERHVEDKCDDRETHTIVILTPRIGPRHALLLHLLGFKTIHDIAVAHPVALMSIPGIGRKRFQQIAQAASEFGLAISPPAPERTSFAEVYAQLAFDFRDSPRT